jgi:curli biogenesis system outer membrane secretion channel CsgG
MRKEILARLTPVSLGLLLMVGVTTPMIPALFTAESAIAETPKQRKKVLVVDFEFANTGDSSYWYSYRGGGAARGISELLINKLVNDGTYIVTSRSAVENYLRDNRISGPIDEATAVKVGKALGVDAVIVGTVTRFNVENRRAGGGIFGIGASSETTKAIVQLTTRAVDTKTQSIIAAMEGVGESSSSGASGSIGIFSGGSSSSGSDEMLSKAAQEAVEKVTEQMKKKL